MNPTSLPGRTAADTMQVRVNPHDLLETLRRFPALAPFQLGFFCERELFSFPGMGTKQQFCRAIGENALCSSVCRATFEQAFRDATGENRAVSFKCPVGLLHFAVPFTNQLQQTCCLLAGGVRDAAMDHGQLERLANATSSDGAELIKKLEQLPKLSRDDLADAMTKTLAFLPTLDEANGMTLALQKITERIQTIHALAGEIDRSESLEAMLLLLSDALIMVYDLPKVVVLIADGDDFSVSALGLDSPSPPLAKGKISDFLANGPKGKATVLRQDIEHFFPKIAAERAILVPLHSEQSTLGLLALFDVELPVRDLLLLELLAGRAAGKLLRLKVSEEQQRSQTSSQQLIGMISDLSLFENREALYRSIVDMSCELLQASRGSLMLVDGSGEQLQIVSAKGINLEVARSLPIRLGEGIAGRVAQSGLFLLVSDIEKDCRIATRNRPRFNTKSFISFPMKIKNRIIGVLNLADKETGHIFTDTDLKHLHLLAGHAAQMIDRTAILEKAQKLEELAARDPLTGLYNRRLLEARFHEEINRCSRLEQSLSIMMVDLDHFKTYNDLCGHIAGDHALRKVAELLKKSAREMDIVTRYGGEEFCLLLPNTRQEEALFVAERIRRAIEAQPFPGEAGMPQKKLTASIGMASFPSDGDRFETLINAADIALYQAKSKGRNRLATFEPTFMIRTQKTG